MDLFADPDFVRDELEQRGPETVRRQPRAGEPIYLYGDRRTVLMVDATAGRVVAKDDAGFPMSRRIDTLWWDGVAWRTWGDR
jgi:hypothetical protein